MLINTLPQLNDNYAYVIENKKTAIIVDPAESTSIINYIEEKNLDIFAILITHHHSDHTAGVDGILKYKSIPVYSPSEDILGTSNTIKNRDIIDLEFIKLHVMETPGHTLDHVVYYSKEYNLLFSGDTLFRLGCGRVFEGTYDEMHESLKKIMNLDKETMVYCGHEYTINNLNFLISTFPDLEELNDLKSKINQQIIETGASIPFKLGLDRNINPFLSLENNYYKEFKKRHNFNNIQMFSYLRDLKNNF